MQTPRPYFSLQNSLLHAKVFLLNLYTVKARVVKKVRQPVQIHGSGRMSADRQLT